MNNKIDLPVGTLIHILTFTPYKGNPHSVEMIVGKSRELLSFIRGTAFMIGIEIPCLSSCESKDLKVVMTLMWETEEDLDFFEKSAERRSWLSFILNGWKLSSSKKRSPRTRLAEVVRSICSETDDTISRDTDVPDSEVFVDDSDIIRFLNSGYPKHFLKWNKKSLSKRK